MGNTFSCQKELPIMPVPSLNKTCHKLMGWAEPLLTQEEQIRTKKVIDQFLQPGGDGEKLQNELIEWGVNMPLQTGLLLLGKIFTWNHVAPWRLTVMFFIT